MIDVSFTLSEGHPPSYLGLLLLKMLLMSPGAQHRPYTKPFLMCKFSLGVADGVSLPLGKEAFLGSWETCFKDNVNQQEPFEMTRIQFVREYAPLRCADCTATAPVFRRWENKTCPLLLASGLCKGNQHVLIVWWLCWTWDFQQDDPHPCFTLQTWKRWGMKS